MSDNNRVLVYGSSGWIGSQLVPMLISQGWDVVCSKVRIENYSAICSELDMVNPSHVLCTAGLTGTKNIDSLEDDKVRTIQVNVIGTSVLADECARRNIHFTLMATGCIYEYDDGHPIGGPGFTEEDKPNFDGSFYSYSKIFTEGIVKQFPTSLVLRLRMPISYDLHPRSFITKITHYSKVINVPNSMSILPDLLPLVPDMMKRKLTGVLNFVNPGVISHNEILELYTEYIDHQFTYQNFSVEEQDKILKARRSNNRLDTSKLLSYYPDVPNIQLSILKVFEEMRSRLH